jgi:hypothetical protein
MDAWARHACEQSVTQVGTMWLGLDICMRFQQHCLVCRCRGLPVEVQVMDEDSHALSNPQTTLHQWLRVLQFINMHCSGV